MSVAPPLRNIQLVLEYDGSRYHGWQRQKNALTIQEVLETCLGRLTGDDIRVIGSGRTDAGVHALGQVANFKTASQLPLAAFGAGLNSMLPPDIAVLTVQEVDPEFHARYAALAKTYEYRLLNRAVRSPLHRGYCWWVPMPLAASAIQQAMVELPGEHDFSAFQAGGSNIKNPVRRVWAASWEKAAEDWYKFRITANGFLRGMVRALVGTLVEIGRGKRPPEELSQILASRDRRRAGPTAPAQGLYLVQVIYDQEILRKINASPPPG
ncbi:MAG: tRNA pseudouridine(38-40) synthase TruA [Deltaproteobacteria bacterium]|nr:tRNA pseudouridine(38-40) synthase TruA [Deltaproteobacteria bacterium]MBW1951797.1 tRNA pseudouridine(38-40) synthase TruA [Deltaproteobacteria bacterium]MBW1985637.1 tRNA pseudouridine(38-40) synthase TruA [Deltaproteobacteria bacterium]MBW2134423.1 tRNA pseudouridine(38-40) synthase TruA [Deltaproteobacteria bacterium]